MRALLVTALRCLATLVFSVVAAIALAMLTSQLVTWGYRAYYRVPAGVNLIEDYRYVAYHTSIVLPIFIAALVFAGRFVWRWSRRLRPA